MGSGRNRWLWFFCLSLGFMNTGCKRESPDKPAVTVAEITASALEEDLNALFSPGLADGFDFPVGDLDGRGSYVAAAGKTYQGWYVAVGFLEEYSLGIHPGEDWNGCGGGDTDLGQPVHSIGKGKVLYAQEARGPYGNIVIIQHAYIDNGQVQTVYSQYDHLHKMFVRANESVERRQVIGTIGKGAADMMAAHLHFEIRRAGLAGFPAEFWPSSQGWTRNAVREHYEHPTEFIRRHRALSLPRKCQRLLLAVKHRYKLYLFEQGNLTRTYEIALGQNPVGTKEKEGDLRVPEGAYRIISKSRGPFSGTRWSPYLGPAWMKLDYPNVYDAEKAFAKGVITSKQREIIMRNWTAGRLPPQDTALGGGIGLHGWIDADWSEQGSRALTWGCISMHNKDLLNLFQRVPISTPVYIWP